MYHQSWYILDFQCSLQIAAPLLGRHHKSGHRRIHVTRPGSPFPRQPEFSHPSDIPLRLIRDFTTVSHCIETMRTCKVCLGRFGAESLYTCFTM